MANFDKAFAFVLAREGGYSNDPADSGGRTNLGITEGTLARYNKLKNTHHDVRTLTRDIAKDIYKLFYWDPLLLDQVVGEFKDAKTVALYDKLGIFLFDQGVNRGIGTSALQAQRVLNTSFHKGLVADGEFGAKSVAALNSLKNPEVIRFLVLMFYASQDAYTRIVTRNPSQSVFIEGWINRSQELLDMILLGLEITA